MTSLKTPSRFTKFLGVLACAAALAPGLAGAQDFRHANRFDNDDDRATPSYAGDQDFRFRGPRYEDPEITSLRAELERIEFRIERREAQNEQLAETLEDANRELRIATAQHRSARARFIDSLGSRRQASAFHNYLRSSQRLMAASQNRAEAMSQYTESADDLLRMEANRDRVQADLDEKIEARRIAVFGRRGHGRFPRVIVTPPSPPTVVVRPRHEGPAIVVTPVGRVDGPRRGGGYYASN